MIKLATLKERRKDTPHATARTQNEQLEHLPEVLKGKTIADQKTKAKTNGSVLRKALVPADFSRVLLAVLHIILGITKKIFDGLLLDLQEVDGTDNEEQTKLVKVRDCLIHRAGVLENEETALQEELEEATKRKEAAWHALAIGRQQKTSSSISSDELKALLAAHKDTCKDHQEKKKRSSEGDKLFRLSLENIADEINQYLSGRRGTYERLLEFLIGSSPFNARHNPFYSGAFNGNDCFRLMENHALIFDMLRKTAADEGDEIVKEKVNKIADTHEPIFEAFANLLPLFRSPSLLSEADRGQLKSDISAFYNAYLADGSSGSTTIKIHHLVFHTTEVLDTYGTIGFWAEDAVESIHAIVNVLSRRYAALDPSRRATQIMRASEARKEAKSAVLQSKRAAGKSTDNKRKRKNGTSEVPCGDMPSACSSAKAASPVEAANEFLTAVTDATAATGEAGAFPDFTMVPCEACKEQLEQETSIPSVLVSLHTQLHHVETGDKFVKNKKSKRAL
jgi:hypothetical protein